MKEKEQEGRKRRKKPKNQKRKKNKGSKRYNKNKNNNNKQKTGDVVIEQIPVQLFSVIFCFTILHGSFVFFQKKLVIKLPL